MSGTEDSILGNIPDFQEEGASTPDVGGGSEAPDTSGSSNEGRSSAQPTSAQPTQRGRRNDGLVERQSQDPETPNARDLVDPVSGRTVARGGIERRVYEESMRAQRENNALKQQVQGLSNALRQSNETIQEAARLGVSPQDQLIAIRVMSDFMRDPVRTLQALVEEVKSKGYQIPFLQEGVSQGMDLNAIGRMIDGKLQPFTQQREVEQHNARLRQQAERDLNAFLDDNREANANLDVLSEMLQAQPGLPLQSAYTKMIRWAHENGLDWTQPLKPQIASLRQQQPTPVQPQAEQRPLPGRRSVSASSTQRVNGAGGGQQFNENASWADIIRSAMHDSGVQIN